MLVISKEIGERIHQKCGLTAPTKKCPTAGRIMHCSDGYFRINDNGSPYKISKEEFDYCMELSGAGPKITNIEITGKVDL